MLPQVLSGVIIALGMAIAAGLPFLLIEHKWRWRWREIEDGRVPTHEGEVSLYRDAGTVPQFLRQAPRLVKLTAFSCLFFGQMFVPGLMLGAFGLLAGGVGLVSIPGLITAAKLYSAGLALLRREPRDAYFKARNAAAWALWLNGVIFAISVIVVVTPLRPHGVFGLGLISFTNAYGLLSVLQALLVLHCTRKHEDALFAPTEAQKVGGIWYPGQAPGAARTAA